jgi:uncharacterized protein (DUF1778 family)
MYADPKRIRENRITIRLDGYEHDLLQALANYQGEQLATLMREMIMREARQLLEQTGASVERPAA